MDYSVNTRPLLQNSDSESDLENSKEFEVNRSGEANEELDGTSVIYKDAHTTFTVHEPVDRFNVVYIIFCILGLSTLIPWNFFVTAEEYWMYKFRDVNNVTSMNDEERTQLQTMFTSYLSIASAVPNTVTLILNIFISRRIPLHIRMMGSLVIMLILFIITTAYVKINTDSWQEEFFVITMIIVVVLNIVSALLCGGVFGIVGKFPSRYISAVVSGQALAGIFAAIVEIISLTFSVSATFSAFVYFMVANLTLVITIIAYIVLSKSVFFKFHTVEKETLSIFEASSSSHHFNNISYKSILKRTWLYCFSIAILFVVSFSVWPSVTALIEPENLGDGTLWTDVYFVPVIGYLLFSTGDFFGRIYAGIIQVPKSGWIVAGMNLLRIGFIPALLLCNAQPRQHIPVLIHSDAWYIVIMIFFAFTNGFLANIAMMNVPKIVEAHEKETASSIMAAFLGVGLAVGSTLGFSMVEIL